LQSPPLYNFGYSINRREILDDIVETENSVQRVGLVDGEKGRLGLIILLERIQCNI
jgi:hypothetical protein